MDTVREPCQDVCERLDRLEAQVAYLLGVIADIVRGGNAGPSPFLSLLPGDDE
ncbi:MAG TPA: hypothetical protein VM287_14335 [Egibacteraceae bacterium]|nr:hypothetical protein [Egibacteraceae bacterium]